MQLIPHTNKYHYTHNALLDALTLEGTTGFWNRPSPKVPFTLYWMTVDDRVVGHAILRHKLTDATRRVGGHIGYAIHPNERGKGYGTHLLHLMLEKAKEQGLREVLMTCNANNLASQKIIQLNGGEAVDRFPYKEKIICRYKIVL